MELGVRFLHLILHHYGRAAGGMTYVDFNGCAKKKLIIIYPFINNVGTQVFFLIS